MRQERRALGIRLAENGEGLVLYKDQSLMPGATRIGRRVAGIMSFCFYPVLF